MKNDVAGVAGAARINQLTRADLTRAERHGKRLDATGRSRAINDQPPITTTGLELNALFEQHVVGAFIPKAHSKAMHVLIQFPKDLIDGDDAAGMLHHARAFTRRVFGDAAIFADRLDRDEKSRHVVDLFVAPKYMKATKHQQKVAVGMTHHLKLLAKEYGQPTGPHGCARALQDALFEYLRDEMGLTEVRRGSPKQVAGPDWLSAEDQRVEELAGLTAQAQAGIDQAERDQAATDAERAETERRQQEREAAFQAEQAESVQNHADRDRAFVERERLATEREQANKVRDAAAEERERAIVMNEAKVAMALASAETARREADHTRISLDAALRAAQRSVDDIAKIRAVVKIEREAAEADRARFAAEQDAAAAERKRIERQRKLEEAQLVLLVRGTDDDVGLDLRPNGDTFSMRKSAMQPDQLAAYEARWPAPLVMLARRLAEALEKMRGFARQLLERKKELDARDARLVAREQDADRDQRARASEHTAAVTDLGRRSRELNAREDIAASRIAEAETRIAEAVAREADAHAAVIRHNRWSLAVDAVIEHPEWIEVTGNRIQLDRHAAAAIDPKLAETLRETPPNWAMNVILARLDVADRNSLVEEREHDAARSAKQLAELISRAGPILTPDQQKVAAEAQVAVKRSAAAARAWDAAGGARR